MTPKFDNLVKEAIPDLDWQDPLEGQHQWQKDMADAVKVQPEVIDANVRKLFWERVIANITEQLPKGYEDLQYVGPMPPTGEDLKTVRKAHLQFGEKSLQPIIVADIRRIVNQFKSSKLFKVVNWRRP